MGLNQNNTRERNPLKRQNRTLVILWLPGLEVGLVRDEVQLQDLLIISLGSVANLAVDGPRGGNVGVLLELLEFCICDGGEVFYDGDLEYFVGEEEGFFLEDAEWSK